MKMYVSRFIAAKADLEKDLDIIEGYINTDFAGCRSTSSGNDKTGWVSTYYLPNGMEVTSWGGGKVAFFLPKHYGLQLFPRGKGLVAICWMTKSSIPMPKFDKATIVEMFTKSCGTLLPDPI